MLVFTQDWKEMHRKPILGPILGPIDGTFWDRFKIDFRTDFGTDFGSPRGARKPARTLRFKKFAKSVKNVFFQIVIFKIGGFYKSKVAINCF